MCNRDEQLARPTARPPATHTIAGRTVCFPVDPESGGTWIGVNDAGLVLALLNRSAGARPQRPVSRGTVIPGLLGFADVGEVIEQAVILPVAQFDPFRLIAVQGQRVVVLTSDGVRLTRISIPLFSPLMFTSSSLGDELVDGPRRSLFTQLVSSAPDERRLKAQQLFHQHQWPTRREISVLMRRADARTVSQTVVDTVDGHAALHYRAIHSPA